MYRAMLFIVLTLLLAAPGQADARSIKEKALRGHIAVLASDEFEGREPGTAGEEKTIRYLSEQWAKAGLKPAAGDGGWYQPVNLVSHAPDRAKAEFFRNGRKLRFSQDEIVLIGAKEEYSRDDVPLFFAGTGLDGNGSLIADISGKALLLFPETPENAAQEYRSIEARADALVRAGAEAIIYVAEPDDWKLMQRGMSRPSVDLEGHRPRAPIQGAVSTEFAVGLFTSAGQDWDKIRDLMQDSSFEGLPLKVTGNFEVSTKIESIVSNNVIGKIIGRKPGNGAVLFMGHWDHFGYCGPEGDEDRICNGAIDNASGLAVLLEVARKLARRRHDRDIYFLATTAEERGLLGAYAYVREPVFPLEDIVVVLNVDSMAIAPRGARVAIVGRGLTGLDGDVEKVARRKRRKIEKSSEANVFLQRQDGWAFTEKGVPALMVGGSFADLDLLEEFFAGPYHGVDDELTDETELGGAAEDANLHVALGRYFASMRKYKRKPTGE